jgi:hypothetical protein
VGWRYPRSTVVGSYIYVAPEEARDDRRLLAEAVVIMPAAASAPATRAAGEAGQDTELLPRIGARVRVLASVLGPGWHAGMFNRLRVEPPCYWILIFAPGQIRRVTATLSVRDLERLEEAAGRYFFEEHDSETLARESADGERCRSRSCTLRSSGAESAARSREPTEHAEGAPSHHPS